jgi:hypothetical protein
MRADKKEAKVVAMKRPIHLHLAFDSATEPIRGTLGIEGDGAACEFTGYLGLISAIETARGTDQPGGPTPISRPNSEKGR